MSPPTYCVGATSLAVHWLLGATTYSFMRKPTGQIGCMGEGGRRGEREREGEQKEREGERMLWPQLYGSLSKGLLFVCQC